MKIAISVGEPAGIGPDVLLQAHMRGHDTPWLVFCDVDMLQARAALLGLDVDFMVVSTVDTALPPKTLAVLPVPLPETVVPARLNVKHASATLDALQQAARAVMAGQCSALVTGPLHKGVINAAQIAFTGHTEFLAQLSGTDKVVMMLVADRLRVALVTTHMPLSQVPAQITPKALRDVIKIVQRDLQQKFHIAQPNILVLGLNPHAGEEGHLGREEVDIITPTLDTLRAEGIRLTGPVSADTAFVRADIAEYDVVVAMYHDQGLPVLKTLGFKRAVNVTLGLPFMRTSVDHGTALKLAGSGQADISSFECAMTMAMQA